MLDIKFIRENPEVIKKAIKDRQLDFDLDKLLLADKIRSELLQQVEKLRAEQKRTKDREQAKKIKEQIKGIDLKKTEADYQELVLQVPNIPSPDVPIGKDEEDNKIIKEIGKKIKSKKNYLDYNLIDIERGAKVSGSRFAYLKGKLVLLEMALIKFAFDELVKEAFVPILPPLLINKKSMQGTGFPPEEIYQVDDLYLIGTSEHALLAMHMDEIIKELPRRYVSFSSCFRKEAGSYGKDVKGLFRMHQFDKIEMFSFCHPDESSQEHQKLVQIQEKLMQKLELAYRLVYLCTGDISISSVATYDIEAWFPNQQRYRETHSCSNCADFQARRLNIRYAPGKFVHTLNGTVFSQRPLLVMLENEKIPQALQKYTGFKTID